MNSLKPLEALLIFVFTILLCLHVVNYQASGQYELTVYNRSNLLLFLNVFVLLTVCYFVTLVRPLRDINSVIAIIVILNLIIITLNHLNNHFMPGRGDIITHLFLSDSVLNSAFIPRDDFYPYIHVLVSQMATILNISTRELVYLFLTIYYVFLVCGWIYFSKSYKNHSTMLSQHFVVFGSILLFSFFHVSMHPSMVSLWFLPYLLGLILNKSNDSFPIKLIILIFCSAMIFAHPVTSFYMLLIICIIMVLGKTEYFKHMYKINITLPVFIVVTLLGWYVNYSTILNGIKHAYLWFFYDLGETMLSSHTEILQRSGMSLAKTIELAANRYGFIITLIAICLFYALYTILIKRHDKSALTWSIIYIFALSFSVLLLTTRIAEYKDDLYRSLRFPLILTPILIGLMIYRLKKPKLLIFVLSLVISFHNTYGLYPSPRIALANNVVPWNEYCGSSWLLEFANENAVIHMNIPEFGWRMSEYINAFIPSKRFQRMPNHLAFSWDEEKELCYIFLSEYDRHAYKVLPPESQQKANQYLDEDILSLESKISRIYDNSGSQVWRSK